MDQDELEIFLNDMYVSRGMKFDPESIGLKVLDRENSIAEIKRFFLLPEFQGFGYGKFLMKTAIDYAEEIKLRKIRLDTMKQAMTAQAIFRKFGFYEIPRYNNNEMAEYFYEINM
jgi:GNAT superfamily N-acetyltransferase